MIRTPEEWTSRILAAHYNGAGWDRGRGSWCILLHSNEPRHIDGALTGMHETLALRIADPRDPHHGHFWWTAEQRDKVGLVDQNTLCFYALAYLMALLRHRHKIPAGLQQQWREVVETGMRLSMERDIHPGYTNIACLIPAWLVLGGEEFGRADALAHAKRKLQTWLTYQQLGDVPREYASPCYTPLALLSLAEIVERTSDPETRAMALEGEQSLWRHVARRYHLPTRHLAGPHSRVYSQDTSLPLLVMVTGTEEIAGDPVAAGIGYYATAQYHPPEDLADLFMKRSYPQFLVERVEPYLNPAAKLFLGSTRELTRASDLLLRMTHNVEKGHLSFFTCHTFFAQEFTLGSISEAWAGQQRNNFVIHLTGKNGKTNSVYERVTFDGKLFSHAGGHCYARTDQKNASALLVRRLKKIERSDLLPYAAPVSDKSVPVQEAALEVYLPRRQDVDEMWSGDTTLGADAVGPLPSASFAMRVGDVWVGFRLADDSARWELAECESGLVMCHVFWRRARSEAMTVSFLAEAGSVSLASGSFAAFRQRLGDGAFDVRNDSVRYARPELTLVVDIQE